MAIRLACVNRTIRANVRILTNKTMSTAFIVDTGATVSTMSVKALSALSGYDEPLLIDFIDNKCCIKAYDASGGEIAAVPIVLRNVVIEGLEVPAFKVFVTNKQLSVNMLGMDFIMSGVSTIAEDEYLEFVYWNCDKYECIWSNILRGREAFEVNALQNISRASSLLKQAEGK